MSNTENSR